MQLHYTQTICQQKNENLLIKIYVFDITNCN